MVDEVDVCLPPAPVCRGAVADGRLDLFLLTFFLKEHACLKSTAQSPFDFIMVKHARLRA